MDEYRRQETTASVSEFSRQEPEHEGRRCCYRIYLQVDQPEQKGNDYRGIGEVPKNESIAGNCRARVVCRGPRKIISS